MPTIQPAEYGGTPPTGAELEADTHGMAVASAGATAAGNVTIGQITLPAGGPWHLFGMWGQVVPATATAAEFIGGHITMDAVSGDMDPDPAPLKLPIPGNGSFLGTTAPCGASPVIIYPIDYAAPGKATIDLIYHHAIASTVAPACAIGVIFGKTLPTPRAIKFSDRVRTTVTAATDTSIGTVTLAEKAKAITAIGGTLCQDGVLTAGEELIGYFRLDSDDIKMTPSLYPFGTVYGAGLGATIGNPNPSVPFMIPVNIPVVGGARIDCFVDLLTAVTNGADVEVFIWYE